MTPNRVLFNDVFGADGLALVPEVAACVVEGGYHIRGLAARCEIAISAAPPGAGVTIALVVEQAGLSRLHRWLWVPGQREAVERMLRSNRFEIVGTYGVFPDVTKSTFVYELGSAAERYAERELLPQPSARGLSGVLRVALRKWTRCNVSLGGLVILGRRL